jgi:hypothetical protein
MGFLTANRKHSYAHRRVASVPLQIGNHSKEDRDSAVKGALPGLENKRFAAMANAKCD